MGCRLTLLRAACAEMPSAGGNGIGGSAMGLGWLLPKASYQEHSEGWRRIAYRPRHGKPPLAVRSAHSAAAAFGWARERYLGASDEEGLSSVLLADPHHGRQINMPNSG